MYLLRLVIIMLLVGTWSPAVGEIDPAAGDLRLASYLDTLNRSGRYHIVFSSDLVTDAMILAAAPAANPTNGELRMLLRPFNLTLSAGPGSSLLVVQLVIAPSRSESSEEYQPSAIPEIIVTSSLHRLLYTSPESHTYLDRELASRVPVIGDEAVRMTHRLPGVSSGGISARSHVRGGEVNEVLFLFDGLRLYEPYHLKDFQSVATIINSNAIAGIDSYTGAYPAQYGDRMSGVVSIDMREPTKPRETEIAISFFNTSVLSMGMFGGEDKGDWLFAGRRGNLDLIADIIDPEFGSPDYQDYLAHVGWNFGARADISANFLVSNDKLALFDVDRGEEAFASYTNQVFWLRWNAEWSDAWRSQTVIAVSDISDRRQGTLLLPGIVSGSLTDRREFSALEFRQDWKWLPARNLALSFGVNMKDLDASYVLVSQKSVVAPFDTILDNAPATQFGFSLNPGGAQYAGYSELRWRISDSLVADLGLRWDQQNYTTAEDDKQYSPRASLLIQPGRRTDIRIGWGQFSQAQEINELQVGDGVEEFFPAQRAEHFVLSFAHRFQSDIGLNMSVYRKSFRTLRPRFENSFNTLTLLPELQFDRIRVDSFGAESVGAEITVIQGTESDDTFWWVGYTWSDVTDRTGSGEVRRSWDQTHALKAGLSWRWQSWSFSIAADAHTGWPKTGLQGEFVPQPNGAEQLVLQVAPRNSSRYSVYHALDARISRNFDVPRGTLTAFLELSNVYNRQNECCDEFSFRQDGSFSGQREHWLPLIPSLGIVWAF